MAKAIYRIAEVSDGQYSLFEEDILLTTFRRETFQNDLGRLGRGSGWVGSILRLFNRAYPVEVPVHFPLTSLELIIRAIGLQGIAEYLRVKGYIVYKPLSVLDDDLADYLRTVGYVVESSTSPFSPAITPARSKRRPHQGKRTERKGITRQGPERHPLRRKTAALSGTTVV